MFRRMIALLLIVGLASLTYVGCSKTRTVAGPTDYDTLVVTDTLLKVDTVQIVDTVQAVSTMHAYAAMTIMLNSDIKTYVESYYTVTITDYIGNFSGFEFTTISRNGNSFTLAGSATPLFQYDGGGSDWYYIVLTYSDYILTFNGGDPTVVTNWSITSSTSSPIFAPKKTATLNKM